MKHALIVAISAVALSGCSETVAGLINPPVTNEKPKVDAPAPALTKEDERAVAQKAICEWAKDAGMASIKVGEKDTPETKKALAGMHAAYKTSCAVTPKPMPANPPPVPKKNVPS